MGWPSAETISAYAEMLRALQWPLVALILGMFFKEQVRNLLQRLRSGEVLGAKFTIAEELEDLKEGIDAEKREVTTSEVEAYAEDLGDINKQTERIEREILQVAALSPRAAVMLVGAEIEQYMRWVAANAELPVRPFASVRDIAKMMVTNGSMKPTTASNLDHFWHLRNRIIHEFAGDDKENLAAVDLGIDILHTIRR